MTAQVQNRQDWTTAFGPPPVNTRRAVATMRAHGALRYQCPMTGSFILVTDDATLATLDKPHPRLRCPGCGNNHVLTRGASS